ncbi:MAG: hypothetical protein JWN36_706 [Microbacteriaceae bacterium]|nr:hypothetical protein [Microbacteriaceae bacterium]
MDRPIETIDNWAMETRQLEYFVAVAEELSFTRAADRLFAVQSTVSAGIAALERELSATLFDRSTRRVSLTGEGESLLPQARAAIEAIDRVRSSVGPGGGIRGRLRVGIFSALNFADLPGLFSEYRARNPLVDLQLVASPTGSTGLGDDVRRGRIDVAFMGLPTEELGDFTVLELARSEFVAVLPAGHPLAGRASVRLADLARDPWVDAPEGFGNRIALERALASAGLSRAVTVQVSDLGDVPRFVAAGLGVAALPRLTYQANAGVSVVPLVRPAVEWTFSAVSRPQASPAVAALLALLGERFG